MLFLKSFSDFHGLQFWFYDLFLNNIYTFLGCSEGRKELMDEPWLLVVKSVMKDLVLSFQHVKCEMKESNMGVLKPTLVARFGRILFYGLVLIISHIKLMILGKVCLFYPGKN